MIDIQNGDILVVGGKEYPVRSAADWNAVRITPTFVRNASIPASTKRGTSDDSGKITPASEYLTGLKCTHLDPVSAELASTAGLDTPARLRQTFVADTTGVLHLIVEELQ